MTMRTPPAARALSAVAATLLAASCASSLHHQAYGSVPAPAIPSVAVTGSPYVYYLFIHCDIRYANFSGHWWEADTPKPKPTAAQGNSEEYGTMTLISATRARFHGNNGDTIDFHPYTATPPPCS